MPNTCLWYRIVDSSGAFSIEQRICNVWVAEDDSVETLRDMICSNERFALRHIHNLYELVLSQGGMILNTSQDVTDLVSCESSPIMVQYPNQPAANAQQLFEKARDMLWHISIKLFEKFEFACMKGIGPKIQDVLRARGGKEGTDWSCRGTSGRTKRLPDIFSRYQWALICEVDDILSGRCSDQLSERAYRDLYQLAEVLN